jgi:hypothetical protein
LIWRSATIPPGAKVDERNTNQSAEDHSTGSVVEDPNSGKEGKTEGIKLGTAATIILSIITALLTSLFAPYVLERWKDVEAAHQLEKAKQDKIIATQFEIVESINALLWRYRQAAGFLMFDFVHGHQSDELLKRHLKEFEDASAEANRECPRQAFRARMYFNSIYVNNKLSETCRNIFDGVDDHISNLLLVEQMTPHPENVSHRDAWLQISGEINEMMLSSGKSLNDVYQLIGVQNIDEKRGTGELELFGFPTPTKR